MSERRTIVVGHRGQDGRLLVDRLRARGDAVIGVGRRTLEGADAPATPVPVADGDAVHSLVRRFHPDEVYYLAARHRSAEERESPSPADEVREGLDANVVGVANFLEAIRVAAPRARLFYAASSLLFGAPAAAGRQTEETPFSPACTYGHMKALAVLTCRRYRRELGTFASCGILYNHESRHRRPNFLSRKIALAVARIAAGSDEKLTLGDLDAVVDWSYAPDFIDAFVRILAHDTPDDFVVASGVGHTVREFVSQAFACRGLDWRDHVVAAEGLLHRQSILRIGDATRLRRATGWEPAVPFEAMIPRLVDAASEDLR